MVLEPGCVCFLPSLLPRLYHLPLSQTPTVVPIPGYLLFAHGVFGHCIALDSQPDQDLDQQRHSAGSSAKILCSMVGLLKSQREECSRIGGGKS